MYKLVAAGLVLLACTGCTDSTKGFVHGSVIIDGEPADTGRITFFPIDGNAQAVSSPISPEGTYEATVPVGVSRVEIRVSEVVGSQRLYNTPDSPESPIREEIIPPEYNDESTLTYSVSPGSSEMVFEVPRRKKGRRR